MHFDYGEKKPVCFAFAMGVEAGPLLEKSQIIRTWRKGKARHWEAVFKGIRFRVLRCGVGEKRAENATLNLDITPSAIISAGSAGALGADLRIGAITVPEHIFSAHDGGPGLKCSPDLVGALREACLAQGIVPNGDPLVTSNRPVFLTRERADLLQRSLCSSVDMESRAIGRAASEIGAKFACLRVISDEVAHSRLPRKPDTREFYKRPWRLHETLSDALHWAFFLRRFKRTLRLLPPALLAFLENYHQDQRSIPESLDS